MERLGHLKANPEHRKIMENKVKEIAARYSKKQKELKEGKGEKL